MMEATQLLHINTGIFVITIFTPELQMDTFIPLKAMPKYLPISYKYRDALKRNYALRQYWISVNLEDVASFDEALADKLYKAPADFLPLFEEAATEVRK